MIGTSGDSADVPHFLEALQPETGEVLWRWNSIPAPGEPGSETWPNADAMKHGGGPMWITGTYDPDLNLLYWGTGNPHPVLAGGGRTGDNLYTCSIVAVNPDTGKLVWSFQPSPHDTHDWDAVETPVLFDAEFGGRSRKLLAQASRNGYFFLLDRATGEHLLTRKFADTDWASGVDKKGRPIPDPAKDPQPEGAFVKSPADGSTNWMAPSYDPDTGLFYVNAEEGSSLWYLMLDSDKKPGRPPGGRDQHVLDAVAVDRARLSHRFPEVGPRKRRGARISGNSDYCRRRPFHRRRSRQHSGAGRGERQGALAFLHGRKL